MVYLKLIKNLKKKTLISQKSAWKQKIHEIAEIKKNLNKLWKEIQRILQKKKKKKKKLIASLPTRFLTFKKDLLSSHCVLNHSQWKKFWFFLFFFF